MRRNMFCAELDLEVFIEIFQNDYEELWSHGSCEKIYRMVGLVDQRDYYKKSIFRSRDWRKEIHFELRECVIS